MMSHTLLSALLCLTLMISVGALSDIVFSPCSWDLYDHVANDWNKILPNTPVPDLECAQVQVPLDWSAYNDPSQDGDGTYYVRRLSYKNYRVDTSNATSQFWLFTGGPGTTLKYSTVQYSGKQPLHVCRQYIFLTISFLNHITSSVSSIISSYILHSLSRHLLINVNI